MTDTLVQIQQQVDARLRELEPLVEEYQQLQAVAESLRTRSAERPGASFTQDGKADRKRARVGGARAGRSSGSGAKSGQSRRSRARRGENREAILSLVRDRPGVSNREIADVTGINSRVVASAVSKYKRDGLLAPEGSGVRLAGEAAGTQAGHGEA